MKAIDIFVIIAISIVAIIIYKHSKEMFQAQVGTVPPIPNDITRLDQQILTLTNTIMTTMRTYGTLIDRRKELEANYIKTGGKPIPYPQNVRTFMNFIRPI